MVEETQEGVVRVEQVLDGLLLPIDLRSSCCEPLEASMSIAGNSLLQCVFLSEAIQLLDFDVVASDVCERGALHEIVRFGLTRA